MSDVLPRRHSNNAPGRSSTNNSCLKKGRLFDRTDYVPTFSSCVVRITRERRRRRQHPDGSGQLINRIIGGRVAMMGKLDWTPDEAGEARNPKKWLEGSLLYDERVAGVMETRTNSTRTMGQEREERCRVSSVAFFRRGRFA